MSRFYGSMTNSRGKEVTAMSADNAHLRGWTAGVRVWREIDDHDRDVFNVVMTGGSGGDTVPVRLGSVVATADGPRWDPADVDIAALFIETEPDSEPQEDAEYADQDQLSL